MGVVVAGGWVSGYPRFWLCIEECAGVQLWLFMPSRRAIDGDSARDVGADVRSWLSLSPLRSKGAKRRKRVRIFVVKSSTRRAMA